MPTSLDPLLVAFAQRLHKGALLILPPLASGAAATDPYTVSVLRFQYNPESITRTRTGQWQPRENRRGQAASTSDTASAAAQGGASLVARSETISFRLVFDATEAILAGRPEAEADGIEPQLAALEQVALGQEQIEQASGRRGATTPNPVHPDELILALGRNRYFPVVLTSLTVTEQKYSPELVLLRAEAEVRFRVLEPADLNYNQRVAQAFTALIDRRVAQRAKAVSSTDIASVGDQMSAIQLALYGTVSGTGS